jgi:hypothetical protein
MDIDPNWGWIPWKQLAIAAVAFLAVLRWIVQGCRAAGRWLRGAPPPAREPTKRDRLAEKLRELDEPYLRRERILRD